MCPLSSLFSSHCYTVILTEVVLITFSLSPPRRRHFYLFLHILSLALPIRNEIIWIASAESTPHPGNPSLTLFLLILIAFLRYLDTRALCCLSRLTRVIHTARPGGFIRPLFSVCPLCNSTALTARLAFYQYDVSADGNCSSSQ